MVLAVVMRMVMLVVVVMMVATEIVDIATVTT